MTTRDWVFSIGAEGFFSGEQSYKSQSVEGNFSANRVTPELKIRLGFSADHYESHFQFDESTVDSITDSLFFNGMAVKSLNEHWSVGAYLKASSSTYNNIKFSFSPAPAVEYNFFSYVKVEVLIVPLFTCTLDGFLRPRTCLPSAQSANPCRFGLSPCPSI